MRQFMPMVVPHPHAGTLTAEGQVTGTHYEIRSTGTWVYEEDLPWLLAERRAVCARGNEPVQCFFESKATAANAVPYRPWQLPVAPKAEVKRDEAPEAAQEEPIRVFDPTGVSEHWPVVADNVTDAHEAEVAEVPPRRKRKTQY